MSYYKLFLNFVVRYIRLKPLRFILNSLAVASGIALFVSIQLVNEATLDSLKNNINAVAGKSEITITAGAAGFSDAVIEEVESVAGVLYAIPMIEEKGVVRSKDGKQTTRLTILGVDMLKEKNVRSYETEAEDIIEDPLEFLNQPDSIIITREFANRFQLKSEEDFELLTADGLKKFTVRGIMASKGPAKAFGGSIAIMDIDGASFAFGKQGKYDRMDIVTDEEHEAKDVVLSLSQKLGKAYEVSLSKVRTENLTRVVRSFQKLLLTFGSLAWFIGLFLVFSSVNMSIELRRREIGMLRATGADRSLILFLFIAEGSFVGLVGGVLGVLGGVYMAYYMLDFISATISAQFHTVITATEFEISNYQAAFVVLASLVVSALAAYLPAAKAAATHPLEAIRSDSNATKESSVFVKIAIGSFLSLWSRFFIWKKWRIADLAVKNLIARTNDVFSNVTVLSLSLFFALFLGVTSHSMKTSMLTWMSQFSAWDMIVTTHGDAYSQDFQPFSESVGAGIYTLLKDKARDGRGLTARRTSSYMLDGQSVRITALSPLVHEDLDASSYAMFGDGNLEITKNLFLNEKPSIIISESLEARIKKGKGDVLGVDTPSGHFDLDIIGVVREYEYVGGIIYINRDHYKNIWNDNLINAIGVKLTDPSQIQAIKDLVENQEVNNTPLMVTMLAPFVVEIKRRIDEGFLFTVPLQMAAFLVAFLGIVSTLIVKTLARMRELGSLRAIGMDKNQVIKLLLIEGVLQAKISLIWILFTIPLLWVWVKYLIPVVMNWIVDFYFPWVSLGFVYLCGVALALVSSYIPARQVIKENIGEAIRYE